MRVTCLLSDNRLLHDTRVMPPELKLLGAQKKAGKAQWAGVTVATEAATASW